MRRVPTKQVKHLTRRQTEVLCLLVGGWTLKKAAALLQVSPSTVMFHKYRLMRMLGLKTYADLVRLIKQRLLNVQVRRVQSP
ncbi:MAG TPA: helix-turn-helix transcriptional regulator [Terriglobales bacterium]|nr:helix-turn-helix transcriptional regulator [Terriglobales bacterium]